MNGNALDPNVFGPLAGFVIALLIIAVVVLWKRLNQALSEKDADQRVLLPAVTSATLAITETTKALERLSDRALRGRDD